MKSRSIAFLVVALVCANFALRYPSLAASRTEAASGSDVFSQLDLLVDLRHEILDQYVETPDQDKMIRAAVEGMVSSLDDPYTSYFSPEDLRQFDKRIRGSFSGIGAEVREHESGIEIVSPLEDSPAWQSGVLAGDIILDIDGTTTKGMDINTAVDLLTGERGTDVTIKVRHNSGEEETITITRDQINVQTIKGLKRGSDQHWDFMLDPENKIGYIRLTQFTSGTADDLRKALKQLNGQGMRGLILDLRFDPGGLLESAVEISDMFLGDNKVVVSVRGRSVAEQVHKASEPGMVTDVPMVVIANEASASASEIVTGALQDHHRAKFIGTRTYGKGSVQQIRMLESGLGAIKITNAYYYLPSGRNIHRRGEEEVWGVDPEPGFYVPMNYEQIEAMAKKRRDSDILRKLTEPAQAVKVTPEWIETELSDPQLAAAVRAIRGKLSDGDWPVVGEMDVAGAVKRMQQRELLERERNLLSTRLKEVKEKIEKINAGEVVDIEAEEVTAEQVAPEKEDLPAEVVPEETPEPVAP